MTGWLTGWIIGWLATPCQASVPRLLVKWCHGCFLTWYFLEFPPQWSSMGRKQATAAALGPLMSWRAQRTTVAAVVWFVPLPFGCVGAGPLSLPPAPKLQTRTHKHTQGHLLHLHLLHLHLHLHLHRPSVGSSWRLRTRNFPFYTYSTSRRGKKKGML